MEWLFIKAIQPYRFLILESNFRIVVQIVIYVDIYIYIEKYNKVLKFKIKMKRTSRYLCYKLEE